MNEDGLGTLAVLPREVRDMISSYVVAHILRPAIRTRRSNDIWDNNFMKISSQLRREFLECFLRNLNLVDITAQSDAVHELLHRLSPMADVATHIGSVGFAIYSKLLKEYDEDKDSYHICPSRYPDDLRYILRAIKRLRHCHEAFGIPSDKLHVTIRYSLPVRQRNNRLLRHVYADVLAPRGCGRERNIEIFVTSKARSLAALDWECSKLQLIMQTGLDVYLDNVKKVEKDGSKSAAWIARRRDLGNKCEEIIMAITSAIREHHITAVDQVTQLWKDGDEFDEYCLGDFFALAEAW